MADIVNGSRWVCMVDRPTSGVMKGDVVFAVVRDPYVHYEFESDGRMSPGCHKREWHSLFEPAERGHIEEGN